MSTQNQITVFEHPQFGNVRIINDENGDLLFVAKDVAEALGYTWNGLARIAHVPEEWRLVTSVVTTAGEKETHALTEQGLYFFLGRSDKEAALPFQKWTAGDVMPSLRKKGSYGQPALTEKDILQQAMQIVGKENTYLNQLVETLAPKADFADAISEAEGGVSVNRFAKILRQHGIKDMGPHRLYRELRRDGFTIHQRGKNWNAPKQKYVEKGWFRIVEYLTDEDDSVQYITSTFNITGKGQQALLAHFMDKYGLRRQLTFFDNHGGRKIIPMPKRAAVAP